MFESCRAHHIISTIWADQLGFRKSFLTATMTATGFRPWDETRFAEDAGEESAVVRPAGSSFRPEDFEAAADAFG